MEELKPYRRKDDDTKAMLLIRENTVYFKPFDKEVQKWKKKYRQALLMLELKDLFNAIYKKGLEEGLKNNPPQPQQREE